MTPITYSALPEDLGGIEGEAIPEPAMRGDGSPYPVLAPKLPSDGLSYGSVCSGIEAAA